jgi:hypothetical protein
MSFGFSVGDFLQVGALALQVGRPFSMDHQESLVRLTAQYIA